MWFLTPVKFDLERVQQGCKVWRSGLRRFHGCLPKKLKSIRSIKPKAQPVDHLCMFFQASTFSPNPSNPLSRIKSELTFLVPPRNSQAVIAELKPITSGQPRTYIVRLLFGFSEVVSWRCPRPLIIRNRRPEYWKCLKLLHWDSTCRHELERLCS